MKSITFVGIHSIQRSMKIVFSLILSKLFLKAKLSVAKGMTAMIVLGGLAVILAAQYVDNSSYSLIMDDTVNIQCVTQTRKMEEITNISSVPDEMITLVKYTKQQRITLNKIANMDKTLEGIPTLDNTTEEFNSSLVIPEVQILGLEKCLPTTTISIVIATALLALGSLVGCFNSLTVSGTTLKGENTVVLTFWEFLIGFSVSLLICLVFENPTFPDNLRDTLLLAGHSVSASSITYLNILAVQNIDLNLYYIMISLNLPLSLLLHLTVLHNASPDANLVMLITGMVVVFASAVFLPVYEYFRIDKVKTESKTSEKYG